MNNSPMHSSVMSTNSNSINKAASRLSTHKEMYKSPGMSRNGLDGSENSNQSVPDSMSPSWRNAYKKRCFDEFKKSRQKLLSKFRNLQVRNQNQIFTKNLLYFNSYYIIIL